jgi:hypothetical protein
VLSHDDAQQVLDELAGRMDAMRVHNPVRYCAKLVERLKRGAFHPDAGLPVARQRQARKLEQRTLTEGVTTTRMRVNGAPDGLFESIRSTLERARHEPRYEQDDEPPKRRT